MKINGKTLEERMRDIPEGQNIPHHIDRWYDRHERSWTIQLKDKYDNQIGDAVHVYSKQEAINAENEFKKEHNLCEYDISFNDIEQKSIHYNFKQHKTIKEMLNLKPRDGFNTSIQDRNVVAEMEIGNLAIDLNIDFNEDGKHLDYWVVVKNNNGDWEDGDYLIETPILNKNLEKHMFKTLMKYAKEQGYVY